MRNFNTLTFNEETWLIQEVPTNLKNLAIYKNGFKTGYFLETVILKPILEDFPRIVGYKLQDESEGSVSLIKDMFHTNINFEMMADVINTIQNHSK